MRQKSLKGLFLAGLMAVLLSGCASSVMQQVAQVAPEDVSSKALVTFMRPSYFGGAIQFGIWDSDKFVGVLSAGSYVQYLTEPGEHVFLARAENWSYMKADLQAGKRYYVIGKIFPGIWKARVAFDPVNNGDEDSANVDKWLAELKPTAVIPEKFNDYVTPRVAQVKEAAGQVDNGKVKYSVLMREDGR